jgi:hypothetical protein
MDGLLNENIQNDPMQSSMVRPFERSRKNILTRRANHLHIFIVARIKPAPENPLLGFLNPTIRCQAIHRRACRTWPPKRTELPDRRPTSPTDGRPAKTMGKPNRNRRFRAIAQAILQALAFKHLKPTQPSPRGRGHITGSFKGVRKYLQVIHHA